MNKLKNTIKQHELIPVMIWTVIFSVAFLIRIIRASSDPSNGSLLRVLFSFLLMIGVFYLHTYILYPFKEKKHGKWYYTIFLILCLLGYFFIHNYFVNLKGTLRTKPFLTFFSFVFIIFISYCYRLYIDRVRQNIAIREKEAIHFKTELDFLRSQISPHFMFNLMNTLVLMARKKSELLEPSLITLSQLMRYMLYDSGGGQISLEKEIRYLKNYINLQLLRFGDNLRFNLFLSGDFEGFQIEPMLLIPFVENAFKHGTLMIQEPIIDVAIKLDNKKRNLILMVMNSTNQNNQTSEKHSGIGLANVKRRLELLYPDKYQIQIEQKDDEFRINLEISL
ncbi:MAG TPA: histidine kinase [Mucilaginibacter sp.]